MRKRNLMAGVGALAVGATASMAISSDPIAPAPAAPIVEDHHVIVVDPVGTSEVMEQTDKGALVASKPHRAFAIAAIASAVAAAIATTFGLNSLLNMLTTPVKVASNAIGKAANGSARVTARVAKTAAAATAKSLAKPGKLAANASMLALVLAISVVVLDIQWKAGLVVGAASAIGGLVTWRRLRAIREDREAPGAFAAA